MFVTTELSDTLTNVLGDIPPIQTPPSTYNLKGFIITELRKQKDNRSVPDLQSLTILNDFVVTKLNQKSTNVSDEEII